MPNTIKLTALAGLFLLAACGGNGDDSQAGNAVGDAAADNLDATVDSSANAAMAENLQAQADALRNNDEPRDQPAAGSNLTVPATAPAEEPATNGL